MPCHRDQKTLNQSLQSFTLLEFLLCLPIEIYYPDTTSLAIVLLLFLTKTSTHLSNCRSFRSCPLSILEANISIQILTHLSIMSSSSESNKRICHSWVSFLKLAKWLVVERFRNGIAEPWLTGFAGGKLDCVGKNKCSDRSDFCCF